MPLNLETILSEYFCKAVSIKLSTWDKFNLDAYFVGIKLPVGGILMLYYVKTQHIGKYLKHQNPRWIEMLPFELIDEIKEIPGANKDIDEQLCILTMKRDITSEFNGR